MSPVSFKHMIGLVVSAVALCAGGNFTEAAATDRGVVVSKEVGERLGVVWGIFIGVSKYKDRSLDLAYADKDATELHRFFVEHFRGRIHPDHFHLLVNQDANRGQVLRTLGEVLRRAQPEDVVILSLAMHGVLDPSGEDLYFLTHEADPNLPEDNAISRHDLLRQISRSKARRIILFLDACHTGAFGSSGPLVAMRAADATDINRLLSAMGKTQTGIAVFSSSSAAERSQEGEQFCGGHGAFTCGLLTGLRGAADENKNGFVEIRELFDFTYRAVKSSTKGFQNPSIEGRYDNALPLAHAVLSEKLSMAVPGLEKGTGYESEEEIARLRARVEALLKAKSMSGSLSAESSMQVAKVPAFSPLTQTARTMTGKDGSSLVLIPEGPFTMGSTKFRNERPVHRVMLPAFYMDQDEVTVARYAGFLNETKRSSPEFWDDRQLGRDGGRPVVGVDWADADAYCKWAGRRLPTEAEWEKAARGTDERDYPWGEESPTPELARFDHCCDFENYGVIGIAGERNDGSSPFGVHDMAGNVWEWTADWYDANYYRRTTAENPKGPSHGMEKTIRGGSWSNNATSIRTTNRHGLAPTERKNNVGFRCAQPAP